MTTPKIAPRVRAKLARLDDLWDELRDALGKEGERTTRWIGPLRREVRASAVEGSTAIEGFTVAPAQAKALVSGERQLIPEDKNQMAVASYARAMDHVGVLVRDPAFHWLDRVILDLHFDACSFQHDQGPGQWRTRSMGITGSGGSLVYRAPDADQVPGLMAEVVEWLRHGDLDAHVVVRAAMAHLHLISVHPFEDGNGRISRIVQALVLARDGSMAPEFASIEEYLGQHTDEYYAALNKAHGRSYEPKRNASGWIAFCIEAHIEQARQRLAQIEVAAARWAGLEELVKSRGWPRRLVIALEQSLNGGSGRGSYMAEVKVSPATASADFRRLLDAGLLRQLGQGRTTRYRASEQLRRAGK